MPDDLLIRPANPDDAPAIAAIHAASWQQAYRGIMPDAFLDGLTSVSRLPMWRDILDGQRPGVQVWVAEAAGDIAGFVSFGPVVSDPATGDLTTLYLHPERTGRGIGRLLLARAVSEMRGAGYRTARLQVLRDNGRARRVYEAAGWTSDGIDVTNEWLGIPIVERIYTRSLKDPVYGEPMMDSQPNSAAWYDQHAAEYASRTDDVDLTGHYERFLAHVPPGGRLLDAGCGPGRDSLAFIARGYRVTAMDASIGMVHLASQRLGQPVRHLRHEDVTFDREFDGIWANASLLHVTRADLPGVLVRYRRALMPGGVLYASFKLGTGDVIASERLFVNQDEASLREVLASGTGLVPIELWISGDRRPGREHESWLNALVRHEHVQTSHQSLPNQVQSTS